VRSWERKVIETEVKAQVKVEGGYVAAAVLVLGLSAMAAHRSDSSGCYGLRPAAGGLPLRIRQPLSEAALWHCL